MASIAGVTLQNSLPDVIEAHLQKLADKTEKRGAA
jgi:hypothetical protein